MTRHSRSAPLAALAPAHTGPVSWQRLLKWLHEDGVISALRVAQAFGEAL